METILTNKENRTVINRELPVTIIGERINPTRNKKLVQALENRDMAFLRLEALKQIEAGAGIIDINVAHHGIDEIEMMREAVKYLQDAVTVPLSFDSADAQVLEAALSAYSGKALVNSVTGEKAALSRVLPLVKYYGAAVVGLTMDEGGIPASVEGRVRVAGKIIEAAAGMGIKINDIVIDPVVTPVSVDESAAELTLNSIREIIKQFGVNITLGVSNISFGLPDRMLINAIFVALSIEAGATCPIIDITRIPIKDAVFVADMLSGKKEQVLKFIAYYRSKIKKGKL